MFKVRNLPKLKDGNLNFNTQRNIYSKLIKHAITRERINIQLI